MFKYAYDSELIAAPLRFGPRFARPTRKMLRLEKAKRGPKMFEAVVIRAMVNRKQKDGDGGPVLIQPTTSIKAMILLGVNCGFGNSDCGTLPLTAINLDGRWVNYHRPKTGIPRRCPLWPETFTALKTVLEERKQPKDTVNAGRVFISYKGESWHKSDDRNPISAEMRKLLDLLGIEGKRNFYAPRPTFETIGGEAKDQIAVDHIMGHARDDMASAYRERISDERLKAVTYHVRKRLFGDAEGK